jgi:hypothetical protein
MAYHFTDPNDIKVFILYILKNMSRPVTYIELNDMVLQDELVSYVDFAECLAQLVATGNVRSGLSSDRRQQLYEITPQGKSVAEALESNIMGYIRTRSLKSALRYLSFKDSGTSISVKQQKREDGRVDMTFTVAKKDEIPMNISLIVDNDYQASVMEYNFRNQPETIYRSVLSLLAGDAGYLLK